MTTDPYLTAARAYCEAKFDYTGPYISEAARERHLASDARSTAEAGWLGAVVDAVVDSQWAASGALVLPGGLSPDGKARTLIGPGLRYEVTEDGVRDRGPGRSGPVLEAEFDQMLRRLLGPTDGPPDGFDSPSTSREKG